MYSYHAKEKTRNNNTGNHCIFKGITSDLPSCTVCTMYLALIALAVVFSMALYKAVNLSCIIPFCVCHIIK